MFYDYRILEITDGKLKQQYTEQILRLLPDWFGDEESLVEYVNTVADLPFFAAFSDEQCAGFFAGKIHHKKTGDIYVCGIHPEHHRLGLGKKLYFELEQYFNNNGCEFVMVKTLSPLRPSAHYNRTREFYHAVGFNDFYTDGAIWGSENPCLIMVKNLNKFQILEHLRSKDGVHIAAGIFDGKFAVQKTFENAEYQREIDYYQLLQKIGLETLPVLGSTQKTLILTDVTKTEDWRLGVESDFDDVQIFEKLAHWYFNLHENSLSNPALDKLNSEMDVLTYEKIEYLLERVPEAEVTLRYILSCFNKLQMMISEQEFVINYNDFYWTNLAVKKDKSEALMFDYNMMGKGYRYSDIRNVCSSLPVESSEVFIKTYNELFLTKHGYERSKQEATERLIDEIVAPLVNLIFAYARPEFPSWAADSKAELISGKLLAKAKKLFR